VRHTGDEADGDGARSRGHAVTGECGASEEAVC